MIILITGITSGFGRAMAERLNADGHTVYGTHRRECEQLPGVHYIKADGLMGLPFQGLYSASKFAIEGYCEALRLEVKKLGIKVVVIEPGDFATSFTASRNSVDDPEAHKAYPSYARSLQSIEKDETGGLKPEYLAGKISRIVRKRNPNYHYIISTLEQRLSVFLKAILPPSWFAAILGSYYHL